MTRHAVLPRPRALLLLAAMASAERATGLVRVADEQDNALTLVDAKPLKTIPVGNVPDAVLVDD